MSDEGVPEIRFALAMNGGVSLAVWIGGVCSELLALVRAGDTLTAADFARDEPDEAWSPYQKVCWVAGGRPRVDVMAGASAGGMNGVFLALGLLYRHEDLSVLRDLWLSSGDFLKLFRDPLEKDPPSLLMGDEFFLPELERAVRTLSRGGSTPPRDDLRVDLQLTVTSLLGEPTAYYDERGTPIWETRHDHVLRFRHDPTYQDFGAGGSAAAGTPYDRTVARLARACRSTASFPGAFEPSLVQLQSGQHPDGFLPAQAPSLTVDHYMIDGGTLVNLPVREALDAIFDQPATGAVRRVFAMVVPDPTTDRTDPYSATRPGLREVLSSAVSSIPRTQSVLRFLDDLDQRNTDQARTQVARGALVQTMSAAELTKLAQPLFDAYCISRATRNRRMLRAELWRAFDKAVAGDQATATPTVDPARRSSWLDELNTLLLDPTAMAWIPSSLDRAGCGRWGSSAARRSAARALYLLELDGTPEAMAGRGAISQMLDSLSGTELGFDAIDWTRPPKEALTEVLRGWNAPVEHHRDVMREIARILATTSSTNVKALKGLTAARAVDLLLALEVVENTFGSFDRRSEQTVEVVRIDGGSSSPLDPLQRRGATGKVAGVRLGHFGSFLKASWRANDWLWGRLDGSCQLVDLLLVGGDPDPARARRSAALAAQLGLVGADPVPLVATELKRQANAAIVAAEAPALVNALEQDQAAGGYDTASGRAIRSLVEAHPTPLSGDALGTYAGQLLTANLIGQETVAAESGSDLLTLVGTQALATGANVFRSEGPKVLMGFTGSIRAVALLTWGLLRARIGGSTGRVLAGTLFGAGLAITTIRFTTSAHLGIVGPIGLAMFAAGTLLAFLRDAYLLVPTLLLGVLPEALLDLPKHRWEHYPHWLPWPHPALDHARWLGPVGFLAAGLVIGLIHRPAWLQRRKVANEIKRRATAG